MGHMTKPVKRLFDLEIDEISLVDRPANQHGLVAIAKRDEDNMPGIFDPDGNAVAEDDLEHGDVVYDDAGNEYVFVTEEEGEDEGANTESAPELASVGKAFGGRAATSALGGAHRLGEFGTKNKKGLAAGAVGGVAAGRLSKGLGDSVYEALSKALNDGERDEVVSKLADEVEIAKSENAALREQVELLTASRQDDEYLEIAKGYNLPVHPIRLASILKSAAATMDDEDLAELDRLLTAQSDLYTEIGTGGSDATSAVLDQVQAMAMEAVGKADVSVEQATVALFEANPAAYDEYLVEKGL